MLTPFGLFFSVYLVFSVYNKPYDMNSGPIQSNRLHTSLQKLKLPRSVFKSMSQEMGTTQLRLNTYTNTRKHLGPNLSSTNSINTLKENFQRKLKG